MLDELRRCAMRPVCVLVAGVEPRFTEALEPLDIYLRSIDCQVIRLSVGIHNVMLTIKDVIKKMDKRRPLMLAYSGHGSVLGWERGIGYLGLAQTLRQHKGDVIVLNDTCYGFKFRHYLRIFRNQKNTGLIVSWDGEDEMYGGTMRDATSYWPHSTIVENEVSHHIFSSAETGDIEVPIQLRWGAILDHLFYPDPSP
jgi:hypothetical protein